MTNYSQLIADAHANGELNSYMANKLSKASEFGMTDEVFEQALDDAKSASKTGVECDEDHCLHFFIISNADDWLDDTFGKHISVDEKEQLCGYIMSNRDGKYKLDNLTDFRILTHKWLCDKHDKVAYPNTMGKEDREPVYDLKKWVDTVKVVYSLLKDKGITREAAINIATADWNNDERFKFNNWLRYYESGNTEKYQVKTSNLKKQALDIDDLNLPAHLLDPKTRSNNLESLTQAEPKSEKKTKKEEELERAKELKRKMRSRLMSFKRLLDKYNDALPHQSLDSLQDEMYALDKSLSKLNIYASVQDRIVRSAAMAQRLGFHEGADLLYKVAQEPVEPKEMPEEGESPKAEESVIESLPEAVPSDPNLPVGSEAMTDVQTIINRLEGVSKKLKSRDTIRELASIDILLNELGMASYFPELTDAQSKLIEAYSYASNKIEGIVAKLRGTGTVRSVDKGPDTPAAGPMQPQPRQQKPQNIDKRQIQQQPVGRVQKELPKG